VPGLRPPEVRLCSTIGKSFESFDKPRLTQQWHDLRRSNLIGRQKLNSDHALFEGKFPQVATATSGGLGLQLHIDSYRTEGNGPSSFTSSRKRSTAAETTSRMIPPLPAPR